MAEKEARTTLYQLIYCAFLEIRISAIESDHRVAFHLADLFHVVPKQLELAAKGECTYVQILEDLTERAAARHMDRWLENARTNNVGPSAQ